jgi:hypothetical protein
MLTLMKYVYTTMKCEVMRRNDVMICIANKPRDAKKVLFSTV